MSDYMKDNVYSVEEENDGYVYNIEEEDISANTEEYVLEEEPDRKDSSAEEYVIDDEMPDDDIEVETEEEWRYLRIKTFCIRIIIEGALEPG